MRLHQNIWGFFQSIHLMSLETWKISFPGEIGFLSSNYKSDLSTISVDFLTCLWWLVQLQFNLKHFGDQLFLPKVYRRQLLEVLTIWFVLQRLSTSVTMVTKGVLKDHLVLLANSMTCAGNLIGFNAGGIKALSRSLNMQIPFTEATLFVSGISFLLFSTTFYIDYFPCELSF